MEFNNKILIDEIINFVEKTGFPEKYLKKAYLEMDTTRFTVSLAQLLSWIYTTDKTLDSSSFILDHEYDEVNFKSLFEYSKKINELFTLKEKEITWNSNLTDEEKNEIIDYVNSTHTPRLRVNRTIRKSKN
jgi:hypothetical protein